MDTTTIPDILVADMRCIADRFDLGTNGFTVLNIDSDLTYDDYHDPDRVQRYFVQVEEELTSQLGASQVKVFRHCV